MSQTFDRLSSALAGRYELERELGRGGMATVYLARDLRHDRRVAVKVLHEELAAVLGAERFLAEIRTTAALQHPHILPLFDSGEAPPAAADRSGVRRLYYVMPFVEGETLRARLLREIQLPVDDAVHIARQAAAALDYAHRHGIVHRDIKPENLLLHDGQVQVADFGIALAVSRAGGERMTQTGLSLGTPHYMAPEQATGERSIDARADVYALGAVLYEMLVGEPPFTAPTAQGVVAKLLTERPRAIASLRPSVSGQIDAAVARALEKLPADRFVTAAAFAQAIDRGHDAPETLPLKPKPLRPATRPGRVLPWIGTALALVAGLWIGRSSAPRPRAERLARFSVALPPSMRLVTSQAGLNRPSVAIAPDASLLVLVATPPGSMTPQLYIRPLDRMSITPIPGTEGGEFPFFSPDGAWIAFVQGGKLKKVPTGGGPVVTITDLPSRISGASWGLNDVIVYGLIFGPLMRTTSDGADTRVVAQPDSVAAESFYHPHLLPDGKTVLATASVPQGSSRIVLVSLSRGDRDTTTVLAGVSSAGYMRGPSGDHLVYVRADGALMSVPFDLTRRRITGSPTLVAEEVDVIAGGSLADVALALDGTLAYARATTPLRDLLIREPDGTVRSLNAGPRYFRSPRFSPDGKHIAVGVGVGANDVLGDIWSYDLERGTLSRLTFDGGSTFASYTPDGQWVMYASLVRPNDRDLLRVRAGGGAAPETVLTAPGQQHEAEVTPDGATLVYREIGVRRGRDIWAVALGVPPSERLRQRRPLAVTPYDERGLAISPDGKWLAYTSDASGRAEVYVRAIADTPERWQVSPTGGGEARWDRTGRALYYRNADTLFRVAIEAGAAFKPAARQALFSGLFETDLRNGYDVSPDGRRFVLVRALDRDRTDELRVVLHAFDARAR